MTTITALSLLLGVVRMGRRVYPDGHLSIAADVLASVEAPTVELTVGGVGQPATVAQPAGHAADVARSGSADLRCDGVRFPPQPADVK